MAKDFQSLLLVGCSGCAATVELRGKKQAEMLKTLLDAHERSEGANHPRIESVNVPRQCDRHMAEASLDSLIRDFEAVFSLACGVGIQTLAELYPNKQVFPAADTMFLGTYDREENKYQELCRACGHCILHETGGICPITRCPKKLLNGPCGGQVGGKCEVGGWKKDCAWILIYKRLKERNKINLFTSLRLPRDYRVSEPPRELEGEMPAERKTDSDKMSGSANAKNRTAYSELVKQLRNGKFVFTGEFEPEKITNLDEIVQLARMLKNHVVAINVTDNPTAFGYINSLIPSYLIQKDAGIEAVYQMTTRDRNRLALFSDVLAAAALGIKNILAITGDYTTVGDTPQAKPVFDLDSATLVYMLRKIVDEGVDLNGNPIENPPKFNIGIGASPNADPLEPEILKLERKVRLGVDFVQTQCVYGVEQADRFLDNASYLKTPILLGIAPFKSRAMMDWMMKYVPGIKVPDELERRLRKAREKSKEAFLDENVENFATLIREIRRTTKVAGIHLMAVGFEWIIPKIIERSKIS